MFLSIDGTFVLQLINFAVFYFVLRAIFLKPVGEAIAKRRAYINGVLRDYEEAVAETRRLRAQGDVRRAAARRDADETVARVRAQASNEAAELAGRYNAQAAERIAQAQATVAAEMVEARQREDALVRDLADTMMQRAIGGAA